MSEPVLRFKKRAYAGGNSRNDVPLWHIAAFEYEKGELYGRYLALCGYEIDHPYLKDVLLSKAKRVTGRQCTKCLREAASSA